MNKENKEEERKPSINSRLDELNKQLEIIVGKQKKKGKSYKLPGKVRSKLKKLHKSKKVIVLKLSETKGANFEFGKVEDNMIAVEGSWRRCEPKHIWNLEGKYPLIVLPTWSNDPINEEHYKKDLENKTTIAEQNFIIKAAEKEEAFLKKGIGEINWKLVIVAVLLLGVGAWVLFGGQTVG